MSIIYLYGLAPIISPKSKLLARLDAALANLIWPSYYNILLSLAFRVTKNAKSR